MTEVNVAGGGALLDLPVLALVRDLMFSSRISATGRAVGAVVRVVSQPAALFTGAIPLPGRMLIVDLNQDGAIDAAAAWGKATAKPTIGFVSHVDATAIAYARKAGIGQVLARSQFVNELEKMLAASATA